MAVDGGSIVNVSRNIRTQWHPVYRLPTGIAEALRITTMTYGDPADPNPGNRGSLLTKTLQATTSPGGGAGFASTPVGAPRTWTYTYNANGQVLTVDGPRTDVSDLTTYAYYANDAACPGPSAFGCRGQLESITNAAGHVTRITQYNAHGQPLAIVDPNGLATVLAYDPRQRLTSRSIGGETTVYDYDEAGQLIRVTLPDGSYLQYTYDAAHRLTAIVDSLGNRIAYTLDLAGNRTRERVFDPANQLLQTRSRVYDNLSRVVQEIGAAGQTMAFSYDSQGNVVSVDGPLAGTVDVTTSAYDALSRLVRVTDPHGGQVNYGYNSRDQLTSVSDPRALTTSYAYDGLNNLNQQVSPDTGTTANTYDAAGNLLTQTDAKGQVTSYAYDALNRITRIAFHDGSRQDYAYDQGANGLGRLTSIVENDPGNQVTGVIQYRYDTHGRVEAEVRTVSGVPFTTAYGYDGAGRLSEMRYPSGRVLAYGYDALGRVNQISTTVNDQSQVIVQNVQYRPFGGVAAFTLGNGQTYARGYDQDGRIANYTLGTQSFAVGYDAASRITSLADLGNPANGGAYGYDNLDRLTSALTPMTAYGYGYDAVGNRLSKSAGSSSELYDYGAASNRLSSVTPGSGPFRSYLHDANGSVTADGVNNYIYDSRGRLVQSNSVTGATTYQVNALGQRVRKTGALDDIVYHYDVQGRLISESTPGGQVRKEYLYLGDIPVAVIQ
jgi:YD repeat-containing protein